MHGEGLRATFARKPLRNCKENAWQAQRVKREEVSSPLNRCAMIQRWNRRLGQNVQSQIPSFTVVASDGCLPCELANELVL